jgi:hypothetical protein
MSIDVYTFRWQIPKDGFRWIEAKVLRNNGGAPPGQARHDNRIEDHPQWVLTDGLGIGMPFVRTVYPPLKLFPALFRTFAQVQPDSREGILGFASEYGNLGIGRPLALTAEDEPKRLLGVFGETHQDWANQIVAMRRAVEVWDLLQARDKAALSRFIRYQAAGPNNPEAWIYDSRPDLPPKMFPLTPGRLQQLIEPVEDLLKPGDVLMPALFLVQRWINSHLDGQVSPRLLYHLDVGKQVLQFMPSNLLGAMWLQFAQAIAGNKQQRACKECGRWFEISSEDDGRTARKLFCSDPCKSRDYRGRKDKARQLKAEGKAVKEIAEEIDTEVATVKKWLTRRKG